MANGTEATSDSNPSQPLLPTQDEGFQLSQRGRDLIEETAELVVELPD